MMNFLLNPINQILIGFFAVMMSIGAVALYFSSETAQQKYNPHNK